MQESQQKYTIMLVLSVVSILLLGLCWASITIVMVFIAVGLAEDANSWCYKYSDAITAILWIIMNIFATIGCSAPIWFIESENKQRKVKRQIIINIIYFLILSSVLIKLFLSYYF